MQNKELEKLCHSLTIRFNNEVLLIAAELQLTMSHLSNDINNTTCLIEKANITSKLYNEKLRLIDKAEQLGFSKNDLAKSLFEIRIAGDIASQLSNITKPITDESKQLASAFLTSLMTRGGQITQKSIL